MTQSLQAAIKAWSELNPDKKIEEETVVKFTCTTPPIDRIDNTVNTMLRMVVHLSLSTNCIDKIPSLSGMVRLERLSLGRNQIKKVSGLDEVPTLKELWISYNQIATLDGLANLFNLETLYISNNKLKEESEFKKLAPNVKLVNCNFFGNPFAENADRSETRILVAKLLPNVKTIDGELMT